MLARTAELGVDHRSSVNVVLLITSDHSVLLQGEGDCFNRSGVFTRCRQCPKRFAGL